MGTVGRNRKRKWNRRYDPNSYLLLGCLDLNNEVFLLFQ